MTIQVVLSNSAGQADSEAALTVVPGGPPKIVKGLIDQIVAEGDELTFEVKVQGDVDNIQWLKDGSPQKGSLTLR